MSDTAYTPVSVPKKTDNAGRPKGKAAYLIFFDWDDVATYTRDLKGVRVTAITFKSGKKPFAIYQTGSKTNVYDQSEGDDDARGFIHKVDFEHPGTDIEISEFKENAINKRLGVISLNSHGADAKIAGTPEQPLIMSSASSQDNNEADKNTFNFQSNLRGPVLGIIAKTLIPETDSADINTLLGLKPASSGL